ncbi:hypothetical protein M422DRAFT_273164 [Sphaerobolus stellatus SS14]|uniref:Uncharacterized protein n=1 Tax=Sphaerobolus stellatus (strain SS14) TaxID=990650 RepID=A0A0C9U9R8_SPHS4|nr:hypothetical protein M422DRAFT_273164 [Sphaerobolus stellatus SS14]
MHGHSATVSVIMIPYTFVFALFAQLVEAAPLSAPRTPGHVDAAKTLDAASNFDVDNTSQARETCFTR